MKTEEGKTFQILKEVPVCLGLTSEILARYDTAIFWATVQGPAHPRMGVIKLPESFQHLLMSPKFKDVFKAMGLDGISQMPRNGVDIRRVYEMLENMKTGGLPRSQIYWGGSLQ